MMPALGSGLGLEPGAPQLLTGPQLLLLERTLTLCDSSLLLGCGLSQDPESLSSLIPWWNRPTVPYLQF